MERNREANDYLALLSEETGLLLVGGQAVNLWAERYLPIEKALASYLPFTSRDADFYRRSKRLRVPTDWRMLSIPRKGRMRLVTHAFEGPHGQTAEVLRSINGLTEEEIADHALRVDHEGKNMMFLSPVALFQAKLANLNSLHQEDRQDLKHLRLLVIITRCFFNEMLTAYKGTERPKQAIDWLNQHVTNIRNAASQKHLAFTDWSEFLPMDTLLNHPSRSIVNFAERLGNS